MHINILDFKEIKDGKKWFLCQGILYDYLSELKQDFSSFSTQRRIVKNRFLDGLYNTVIAGEPIPPFTLTYTKEIDIKIKEIELDMGKVEILDGLQRTFRLWMAYQICQLIRKEELSTYLSVSSYIADADPAYLELDFMTSSYLRKFFEIDEKGDVYHDKIIEEFKSFKITFAIWTGLTDADVIKKMLVLNAGQRPMSSTHQYELLFLRYFERPEVNNKVQVKLYREKDAEYNRVKEGNRQVGEFQLSSAIIALQSMIENKPQRVAPSSLMRWDVEEMMDVDMIIKYFNAEYLTKYLNYLYKIDKALSYSDNNVCQWFGKDTSLSGVFAALGKCYSDPQEDVFDLAKLDDFIQKIEQGKVNFCLDDFDKAYSELSSVRINVGNIVRKAIYVYTNEMIQSDRGDWSFAFDIATSGRLW